MHVYAIHTIMHTAMHTVMNNHCVHVCTVLYIMSTSVCTDTGAHGIVPISRSDALLVHAITPMYLSTL